MIDKLQFQNKFSKAVEKVVPSSFRTTLSNVRYGTVLEVSLDTSTADIKFDVNGQVVTNVAISKALTGLVTGDRVAVISVDPFFNKELLVIGAFGGNQASQEQVLNQPSLYNPIFTGASATAEFNAFFRATVSTSTSTANGDVINFNQVIQDPSGNYNGSSKAWVIPVAGVYAVIVSVQLNSPSADARYGFAIRRNGSAASSELSSISPTQHTSNTLTTTLVGSVVSYYEKDDFIDISAIFSDTKTVGGPGNSRFAAFLVRAGATTGAV